MNLKLKIGQYAPSFQLQDIYQKIFNLDDYKEQMVYLSFRRFAACAFCNLRLREVEKESAFFKDNGVVLVTVYESKIENLLSLAQGIEFASIILPDPDAEIYNLYGVGKSTWGVIKGTMKGFSSKAIKGFKLFEGNRPERDGTMSRMPAELLIGKGGKILYVNYEKYLGDETPIAKIKKIITQQGD